MTTADHVEQFRRAESLLADRRPLAALEALAPVLDAEPDAPSVLLLAGRAYFHSAQLGRAELVFRRLVEADPTDHYSRFVLGRTLQRQGRFGEALTQLRMAIVMDPRPDYQDALGEVQARLALGTDPPADPADPADPAGPAGP
ncbi:MAG TPA: tetratricopeptide repeat protein [Pseudonocardiaceae bacterium]